MTPVDALRIGELPGTAPTVKLKGLAIEGEQGPKDSFGNILFDSLKQVNHLQHQTNEVIKDMETGGPTSLHDTMIALERAETSFKLMMQVRNKIVDAYHEVLRMQV